MLCRPASVFDRRRHHNQRYQTSGCYLKWQTGKSMSIMDSQGLLGDLKLCLFHWFHIPFVTSLEDYLKSLVFDFPPVVVWLLSSFLGYLTVMGCVSEWLPNFILYVWNVSQKPGIYMPGRTNKCGYVIACSTRVCATLAFVVQSKNSITDFLLGKTKPVYRSKWGCPPPLSW